MSWTQYIGKALKWAGVAIGLIKAADELRDELTEDSDEPAESHPENWTAQRRGQSSGHAAERSSKKTEQMMRDEKKGTSDGKK